MVPTRAFALTQKEAANGSTIVKGQFSISGMMCRALFDFGATHSYVSMNMIDKWSMPCKLFEHNFSTMLQSRDMMLSTRWLLSTPITIEGRECLADLIELSIQVYDFILGMDWLSKHWAMMDGRKKTMEFIPEEGEIFSIRGDVAGF
ncbi:uncharacterized protein LOC133800002 [Humulus lupulus]|uniref:uncharacterized protein LOC133800002 n=1 Tax=Humulus lupulus TaxID=3486 RepID=UPI002B411E83|nr:uncharacterized protein LOC133800002 [Humulus lupulus]